MAIRIPSSRIYSIDNKKIPQNVIDKVTLKVYAPKRKKDIKTQIYEQTITETPNTSASASNEVYNYRTPSGGQVAGSLGHELVASITRLNLKSTEVPKGADGVNFRIPKKIEDGVIDKVYFGYDKEGDQNISVDIYYDVKEEEIEANITNKSASWTSTDGSQKTLNDVADLGEISVKSSTTTNYVLNATSYFFERSYGEAEINIENKAINSNAASVVADSSILTTLNKNLDNISRNDVEPHLTRDGDYVFAEKIMIASEFEVITLSAEYYAAISPASIAPPKTLTMSGKRTTYTPKSIKISIYGDTQTLELEERTETFGTGNKVFEYPSNELMQDFSFVEVSDDGALSMVDKSEYLCNKVIDNYKNGKESAVILCSVPEDLSVFELNDEVIPMVFGYDGEDRPMSVYKNGDAKVFNVVGSRFIYDGAVWQEITVQEKTAN